MPVGDDEKTGNPLFGPNPPLGKDGKPTGPMVPSYIIWDSHQSAASGFSVRVAAKRTYILRRKVLGRSTVPTLGNVTDFDTIDTARKKAAAMDLKMIETGKNPNVEARRVAASEFTVGMTLGAWMTRIEQAIMTTAPNIYNSLKPFDWPPLPAPDPDVCTSAKARTGRSRKDAAATS